MKRALMIAFHYPPARGSSGVQRTLKFSRYLRDHDWHPIVLTVHPRAYPNAGSDLLAEIPEDILVHRAFALDAARHLAVAGRYPAFMATPDRWSSWWLGGVISGLQIIRKFKPALIWSTYPIATAHCIGAALQRVSKLPWIADFRDSMTEDHYPRDPYVRKIYRRIERRAVKQATRIVFTAPGTLRMYAQRYGERPSNGWSLIENGYDEENFANLGDRPIVRINDRPVKLIHSGILYPSERDPTHFFSALSELKREGLISAESVKVVLRATGHDQIHAPVIKRFDIEDIVTLAPSIGYEQALAEMLASDGLLLFQATNCNHQIPAKLFEYMRAQRPILALTDPTGDTAQIVRESGLDTIARLDSSAEIKQQFIDFLIRVRAGTAPVSIADTVRRYSRRSQTARLAALFNEVVDEKQ